MLICGALARRVESLSDEPFRNAGAAARMEQAPRGAPASMGLRNVSRFRKHQPGIGRRRVSHRCSGRSARGWRRMNRVNTGTVGKIPRRATSTSPVRRASSMYSATGRSPGCLYSDAVRISRPCRRKCTRDCRCARFGTDTSSSPPGRRTRRSSASAMGCSSNVRCSSTSRHNARSKTSEAYGNAVTDPECTRSDE